MIFNKKEYDFHLQNHRRALSRLRLDIDFFLEEVGPLHLVSITDRLKTFESATEKATRMNIPLTELDDLAGLRVVVGTLSEQNTICHFFRDGLRGVKHNVLKDKFISRDGYRAHHIVLEIPPEYIGTWEACKVEVQVQTVFQSAFNMLSRSWVYKTERPSDESWYENFQKLSEQLEEIDNRANELQIMLSNINVSDNVPLSPLAFQAVVMEVFNESCDEDSANWYSLYYRRRSFENCGQLRRFFKNEQVEEVFQKYKARFNDDSELLGSFAKNRHSFWQFFGHNPKVGIEILEKLTEAKEQKNK